MSRAVGVVDLGSNTARLAIYAVERGGGYHLVTERRAVLRLGGAGPRLGDEALARTVSTLLHFRRVCDQYGAREVVAVATAAVRQAEDGAEFLERLRSETGVDCQLLDGAAEAQLGFVGALNTLAVGSGVLADVGGGSTEVTRFQDRRALRWESVPAGALNLTSRWLSGEPPAPAQLQALREHLAGIWMERPWLACGVGEPLVGVGGAFRALAKMALRRKGERLPLHGAELPAASAGELLAELAGIPTAERVDVPGLPAHRADIILAGLAVIAELAAATGAERIVICGHGLRDGLFYGWLKPAAETAIVPDVLAESLRNCMSLFGVRPARARRVARLATSLFDGLEAAHGLGSEARLALEVGAQLRDAGSYLDYYERPEHAFYLVLRAPLFGLEPRARELAAAAAAFEGLGRHRDRWAAVGRPLEEGDAGRLGLMAALADALADLLPAGARAVDVTLTRSLARVEVPVARGGESLSGVTSAYANDFRRLFSRPLKVGPRA